MSHLNTLLAALIAIVIAGCSQQQPVPPAESDTPAPAPVTASTSTPVGYLWLPDGVVLDFPYHLRNDRILKGKNDTLRRRVVLEYLAGDSASIMASVEQSMTEAGFKSSPHKVRPNGKTIMSFKKKGYGNIRVTVNEGAGDKPANPGAKGKLAFNFPESTKATAAP